MLKDPELNWDGAFPYDLLAPGGVTPESSMRGVQKAKLYYIRERKMAEAHQAFVTMEKVRGRLLIDFFLYRSAGTKPEREHKRG